ncbi:MAG TPA: MFS transporter [Opitutaceae bacterium]|nr:MFS transporter [Opitutaceae bacterium]
MNPFAPLKGLTPPQWRAFAAAYLGWMLDAFDYFIVVMVIDRIAGEFQTKISAVSYALFLTLAFRPVGALIFGVIADKFGRRPSMMASILLFTAVELGSGFAPSLSVFLVLRAIFGIGMGGEWGVGASLCMETVPAGSRGIVSGILQQGYPMGNLLAAVAAWTLLPLIGWRGMFIVGALPAILIVFIRMGVHESPAWIARDREAKANPKKRSAEFWTVFREKWPLLIFMIVLMTAFNCFSHGTQDLYPKGFLGQQRGLPQSTISKIAVVYSLGAIAGGIVFGSLSQVFGRRKAIAAAAFLALPMIPLWVGTGSLVGLTVGAFMIQFAVQGAWGAVPAHLNELSPAAVRGTLPGLVYQLGNLGASYLGPFQAKLAESHGGNYSFALGSVIAVVAVAVGVLALIGPEARTAELAPAAQQA